MVRSRAQGSLRDISTLQEARPVLPTLPVLLNCTRPVIDKQEQRLRGMRASEFHDGWDPP